MRLHTMTILATLAATFVAAGLYGCSSSNTQSGTEGGAGASGASGAAGAEGDSGTDAPSDATTQGPLPFTPANIDFSGMDLSQVVDEDVTSSCEIRADGTQTCFTKPAFAKVTQSDGTKLAVYVVKSLKVEPTVHMGINALGGNIPVAIVSLGDFTMMGTLTATAQGTNANGGGFESLAGQDGFGPGGGPKATTNTGAGGGSYCGLGGKGNVLLNSGATAPAPTPAAGTPEIVPLRGGASGGGGAFQGGAGGGGVELVAGGAFKMSAGSYVNVGGGGGGGSSPAGGGGAGGSLLIQAMSVQIAGTLAANGGGGGSTGAGYSTGNDGTADATPAPGGTGEDPGGVGSAGTSINGADAPAATIANQVSGGGGGAGRIRIDSQSGQADLTGATLSPDATTPCVTQGTVK